MGEYTQKLENNPRTLENISKVSKQAPISEILQAYKNRMLGRRTIQCENVKNEKSFQSNILEQAPVNSIFQKNQKNILQYVEEKNVKPIPCKFSTIQHAKNNKGNLLEVKNATPKTTQEIVQRAEKEAHITGITHLVRKKDNSIFAGQELPFAITEENLITIDTNDKIRSRRGPNQELFKNMDKTGNHSYRWFKVLQIDDTDYRPDNIYIRDETLDLSIIEKGGRNTVIDENQRERVDTLQQALKYMVDISTDKDKIIGELSPYWDQLKHPKKVLAKNALTQIWGICGMANENLILKLKSLGAKPQMIKRLKFEGKKDAESFRAFLLMPVETTTIIQISNPILHEFSIEKRENRTAFFHQGYLSKFNALWWAGLLDDEKGLYDVNIKDLMSQHKEKYGNLRPINLKELIYALAELLEADKFGEEAVRVWSKLPFPAEPSVSTTHSKIEFQLTLYEFLSEDALENEYDSLIEKILRETLTLLPT